MQRGETFVLPSTEELAALQRYEQLHRVADKTTGELGHAAVAAVTGGLFESHSMSFEQIEERQGRSAEQLQETRSNMGAVAVLDTLYGPQPIDELMLRSTDRFNPDRATLGYANA